MDLSRIAVVFWLFLPVLFFAINRLWRRSELSKYRVITSGHITDAYYYSKTNPDGTKTNEIYISYTFKVGGIDYAATDVPFWGTYKKGDRVKIRYDPDMPGDSEIWRPGKTWEWLILVVFWFSWVLGTSFFVALIGVAFILGGAWSIKYRTRFTEQGVLGIIGLVALVIFLFFFGFLLGEMGVDVFRNCGFVGQVWLWTLWNHLPPCFLP